MAYPADQGRRDNLAEAYRSEFPRLCLDGSHFDRSSTLRPVHQVASIKRESMEFHIAKANAETCHPDGGKGDDGVGMG